MKNNRAGWCCIFFAMISEAAMPSTVLQYANVQAPFSTDLSDIQPAALLSSGVGEPTHVNAC